MKSLELKCQVCWKAFYVCPSAGQRRKHCSKKCKGVAQSLQQKKRALPKLTAQCEICGISFETRPSRPKKGWGRFCSRGCQSVWQSEVRVGENSPTWKGGITAISSQVRNSKEYQDWRLAIYARDNWTCQGCFKRGGILRAHHVFSFADFPEYRLKIWNGVTLCPTCHALQHPEIGYHTKDRTVQRMINSLDASGVQ